MVAPTVSDPAAEPAHGPEYLNKRNGKRSLSRGHGGAGAGAARHLGKKHKKERLAKQGSTEEVLQYDIQALLAETSIADDSTVSEPEKLPEEGSEIEVEVLKLSSTGDGLARKQGSKQIYVVPFAVPGDIARVKVYRHFPKESHSVADFESIVKPSPLRDDSRVQCQYFAKCGGCQFQMMDYTDQLRHKKTIMERAYQNFSDLASDLIPEIQNTFGSPLQYGYRTKLTPHFDGPPGFRSRRGPKEKRFLEKVPDIGFMRKGGPRKTIDVEDCPIGTEAVRKGMARERERIKVEYGKYERGATILLRESTKRIPKKGGDSDGPPEPVPHDAVTVSTADHTDFKTCITDNNATSTEYVDDFIFTNPAGSFFQNNNSILGPFTAYIREHILRQGPAEPGPKKAIKHLVDAYSGSGLFTITLSRVFAGGSIGIDLADKSIECARRNARLNRLPEAQCRFIAADAAQLFGAVAAFDPDETAVVLDPPRKGCDAGFLRQLLRFAPARLVYVSCNVHTQARDVGVLVRGQVDDDDDDDDDDNDNNNDNDGRFMDPHHRRRCRQQAEMQDRLEADHQRARKKTRYAIESLRGFDFFPQTGHVEAVAVLNRVDG